MLSSSKLRAVGAVVFAGLALIFATGCSPSGPKALLQGEQLINQGKYDQALKKLKIAAEKMPDYPQVWNHMGLAYHGQEKTAEAIGAYQKALSLDKNLAAAHYNLGSLFLGMNRLPEALSSLTTFTILQPNEPEGWLKLAAVQLRLGKPDDAELAVLNVLRMDPKNAEAHNEMGLALIQKKRPREALQAFNNALQSRNNYPPALLNQAVLLQNAFGNKSQALERYKLYLAMEPNAKDAAAIKATIAQLEQELNPPVVTIVRSNPPPPAVTTNASVVARKTNAPPILAANTNTIAPMQRTNSVAARPVETPQNTNAPTISTNAARVVTFTNSTRVIANIGVPSTNNATTTNKPAHVAAIAEETNKVASAKPPEEKEEKLEVVRVAEEPQPAAVHDVLPPPNTNAVPAQASKTVTNSTVMERDRLSRIELEKQRERDKKLPAIVDKMNPMSWFKGNKPEARKYVDTPEKRVARALEGSRPIHQINPAPPPVAPAPKPEFPRYTFHRDLQFSPGDHKKAEEFYNFAVAAHQENKFAGAIELYKQAVRADPAYFDAHYNLALAAYQMKNLPLALAESEAAVRLRPESINARYNFALALRDANYPLDAADQLRQLLIEAPDETRAHFTLANLYAQQLDEPPLALRHYQRVLQLEPNHPQAPQIRSWIASAR